MLTTLQHQTVINNNNNNKNNKHKNNGSLGKETLDGGTQVMAKGSSGTSSCLWCSARRCIYCMAALVAIRRENVVFVKLISLSCYKRFIERLTFGPNLCQMPMAVPIFSPGKRAFRVRKAPIGKAVSTRFVSNSRMNIRVDLPNAALYRPCFIPMSIPLAPFVCRF